MGMFLKADEYEVGLSIICVEAPNEARSGMFGETVITKVRTFFSDYVWDVVAMDLPHIVIEFHRPQTYGDHIACRYIVDTREYKFKKVNSEILKAIGQPRQ